MVANATILRNIIAKNPKQATFASDIRNVLTRSLETGIRTRITD